MKSIRRPTFRPSVALRWSHHGIACRVTPWPDARFQRRLGAVWRAAEPDEASLASAAAVITVGAWQRYLEFVPPAERALLVRFRAGRIAALQVITRCPEVAAALTEIPALVAFLAAHQTLRGEASSRWTEINAVFERSGLYGLLEWLGLPASRQTLAILQQVSDPDLPLRVLEPLRTSLWEPETIWALQHEPAITSRQLERYCQALAA
jgi:hypothetical protein